MAKAPLGSTRAGTSKTFSDPADPASMRVEQAQAEYAVAASRTPASILPQGAAGAWLLYRDRFLNSSAQTQISATTPPPARSTCRARPTAQTGG